MGIDRATYERAVERAQVEGLQLKRHYFLRRYGPEPDEIWEVVNPAHEGYYTVTQPAGLHATTCNCKAGQAGTYCKHRALVRAQRLMARTNK